jgi:sulfite reductase alpha subunit-like flavoprotein
MVLYFGCRRKVDFIFNEELESYLDLGTLHKLKVAYS